jgi:DNA-binding MarR family transcriptional regulator
VTDDRVQLIQRILTCSGSLFHNLNPTRNQAWLNVDLTMPQLKALMCAARSDGATSGQIAASLGIGLSTLTGIVDRLAEQNLVTRREDLKDRRITRVIPTPRGRQLVDDLLEYRKEVITALLSRMDADQLRTVDAAFTYLVDAATDMAANRPPQEEALV